MLNHHHAKQMNVADATEEQEHPHNGVVAQQPKSAIRGMVQKKSHHHKKKEQDSESHAVQISDQVTESEVAAEQDGSSGPAPAPGPGPAPGGWILKMDTHQPIAEQGFQGEKVFHNDKETMSGDWLTEFGPKQGGEKNIKKICSKSKHNRWCRIHGYYKEKKKAPPAKAAAAHTGISMLTAVVLLVAVRY
eukprot:gnl/TRDRNA2_/TRDRNA2_179669_c0_seq1.p1 gnl/TRDRNA2_/TRDRNA2_179669_c0~~gnl/TRDRNA2_/TRDRNA2_179669_c0_seq1.p1  ORF type:complete len:190 (+),score=55.99 gnl/TRDRNA2_/TRDRNA2_179669_c0_seq1:210-779(+)